MMTKKMASIDQSTSMTMTKKLEGKVAIVTGGASGFGEATARIFVEHGARAVVIADVAEEKGRAVAESIGSRRCSYVKCDVSDEEQVKAMVDWTVGEYGQLDIVFSNAGAISSSDQTILDLDLSKLDRLMKVNVRGNAACLKHGARAMVERRVRGTIVCTASIAASNCRGMKDYTDYVASKHAVLGLVRSASQQLGVHGIRVNSVSPSAVATPLTAAMGLTSEEIVAKSFEPFTSLKGVSLNVKHVAETVLFLASDDSAFINGHDLVIDGGLISFPTAITN